jgi:hypothetical protein
MRASSRCVEERRRHRNVKLFEERKRGFGAENS